VATIPRIERADATTIARGEPFVLAGGARALPAFARWSLPYLKHVLGDTTVRYKRSRGRAHPDFTAATLADMFATGAMPFADLLDAMTTGPIDARARVLMTGDEHFLTRVRDGEVTHAPELRPLLADVTLPALVPADRLYTIWTWFSGAGVRTWLHYDNNDCHNLNAQICGRKRCWLFAAELAPRLALFPAGGANPATNCSSIDVDDPTRRAELDALPRWEGELDAGDLLFIPANWLHTFEHLGELNANVNFWWRP
jgi:lysine-specific demethylase 8